MTTMEKILQEIEEMEYPIEGIGCGLEDVGIADRYEAAEYGWNEAVEMVYDIIKNHLSDADNNGWILVEDGLPETNVKVDVTFKRYMPFSKKYRYERCNAVYIPEKTILVKNMWSDYNQDGSASEYDEKTDNFFVKEGWYETIENWDVYTHVAILEKVIAWRHLPEPYQPERSEE